MRRVVAGFFVCAVFADFIARSSHTRLRGTARIVPRCFTGTSAVSSDDTVAWRRARVRCRATEAPKQEMDWRDFRARLVEGERRASGHKQLSMLWNESGSRGWAYPTPLIEKGTVLLSQHSSRYALRQQYFHKAVILIVQHDAEGTVGLILNRPTARSLADVSIRGLDTMEDVTLRLSGMLPGSSDWNVWFGGDCHGLDCKSRQEHYCLHTRADLADAGETIINGVYSIPLSSARALVALGQAEQSDFLLLVGYCGWKRGQLQDEVDAGDRWCVAAADSTALLGDLQCAQKALAERKAGIQSANGHYGQLPAAMADVVGDGRSQWESLFSTLKDGDLDVDTPVLREADGAMRYWIESRLLPKEEKNLGEGVVDFLGWPKTLPRTGEGLAEVLASRKASYSYLAGARVVSRLSAGTVLRASATDWVLGSPDNCPVLQRTGFSPAQYMHKAVFVLISDWVRGMPAYMTLLTGPKIGFLEDEGKDIFFGGNARLQDKELLQEPTGFVLGQVKLPPLALEELLVNGGLTVAWGVDLAELLAAPRGGRWEVAGGNLTTIREASIALLGDQLRRRWYREMMKLDLEE